jgi:Ca2+/H+ antiporter, TMEM165/GDT1 family
MIIDWTAVSAVSSAFLASFVEVVEAFTIVLAVGVVQGWRPALIGAGAALALLAALVVALGPLIGAVPIHVLQTVIGILLLLFGLRWLRKAMLRALGVIALHDEELAFDAETQLLQHEIAARRSRADWIAGLAAFKAVTLEGLEVVFIVIAVGAGRGLLWSAALGAALACILVLAIGLLLHKPLARVPENALKFGVGVMLSAFGVFWTAEGLGAEWPGRDFAIVALALGFLAAGLLIVRALEPGAARKSGSAV